MKSFAKSGIVFFIVMFVFLASCASSPQDLYNGGNKAFREKNYDVAIAKYTKIIEKDTNYEDAYYWRGRAYLDNGDSAKAKDDFNTVLKLNPNSLSAKKELLFTTIPNNVYQLYSKAQTLCNEGKLSPAIELFTEVISLAPDFPSAYNDRGVAYQRKYMYEEAEADYNEALKLDPDYYVALANLGDVYRFNGDPAKAIEYYTNSIIINREYDYANQRLRAIQDLINDPDKEFEEAMKNARITMTLNNWNFIDDKMKADFIKDYPEIYKNRFED
jgi:tetratricopeptide (TPR) repeat protein